MPGGFLHAPPDQFGFLEDNIFQVTLATYLGQACLAMEPLLGRYFGKQGARLDKYSANPGATALPGAGHHILHNNIQAMKRSMMKLGGISSNKDAANFLVGWVSKPHIDGYVTHVTSHPNARNALHAIVPNILAHNYLTGFIVLV